MSNQEEEDGKEDADRRKRPPNRKRLEEEIESIMAEIKDKDAELKSLTGAPKAGEQLKNIRAEKEATIGRRKKVDAELKVLNQQVTEKMNQLSKLQSSLRYTTEEKHNDAIRKLEWNMNVQNFKLSEEKKIVAEIDTLKRSKKMLGQYLAKKREIDESRDKQRRMREERDHYFRSVNQLKIKEDDIRKRSFTRKSRADTLKKEIDELYEKKRSLVSEFRKQRDVFQENIKRQRAESFRKREEERRAQFEAQQKEIEKFEAMKEPYEDERLLCNTLISYLQKIGPAGDSLDSSCSQNADESSSLGLQVNAQAAENEDGYRLLRKSDDSDEFPPLTRRTSKNRRRSRKLSTNKPVTHTPQVIRQFASLNLSAPSNITEIPASLEQLHGRKLYYEQMAKDEETLETGDLSDATLSSLFRRDRMETWGFLGQDSAIKEDLSQSETGVSTTESAACEMSRQASKTESCESANDTRPSDTVMEELLQTCCDGGCPSSPKSDFQSVDSCSLSESSDTPRSESTLEGSNGDSVSSEKESVLLDVHIYSSNVGKSFSKTESLSPDSCNSKDSSDCDRNKPTGIVKPIIICDEDTPAKGCSAK